MTHQASTPVRSLHKLGLGINLGGTLFGLVALNPSVKRIGDRRERGRVLNAAWMRFQAIATLAMATTVAMWRLGGLKEAEGDLDAKLAGVKNFLLGGALVTSVGSAIVGIRIARQAPEGEAPPAESGNEPTPEAARSQRLSAFLGSATVALVAGVLRMSSALEVGLGRAPGGPAGRALFVPDRPARGCVRRRSVRDGLRGSGGARRVGHPEADAGQARRRVAALLAHTRHAEGLLRALRR